MSFSAARLGRMHEIMARHQAIDDRAACRSRRGSFVAIVNANPEGDPPMRFMMIVKASRQTEAGVLPSADLVAAMDAYNHAMMQAGVLRAGEGLHPSAKGARIAFRPDGERVVTDGPFAETKELVAGFWLIEVASKADAVAWALRCPNPLGEGESAEIELRQVFDACDFPAELRAAAPHEAAMRAALAPREGA